MTLEEGLAYYKRLLVMAERNVEQLKRDIELVQEQIDKQKEQKDE